MLAVRWPAEIGQPAAVRLARPVGPARRGEGRGQGPFAGSVQVLLDPVSRQPLRAAA